MNMLNMMSRFIHHSYLLIKRHGKKCRKVWNEFKYLIKEIDNDADYNDMIILNKNQN